MSTEPPEASPTRTVPTPAAPGERLLLLEQEAEEREQQNRLLRAEAAILAGIARGTQLDEVLSRLCLLVEEFCPEAAAYVLLLDPTGGSLRVHSAPSRDPALSLELDGLMPGECAGSCGTAAFRNKTVIVSNIETDPLWRELRPIAQRVGLRADWSAPIRNSADASIGTFSLFFRSLRSPEAPELELLHMAARLCGLALERERGERARLALEADLQIQRRLEGLGSLAGGIAHKFNNLLTVVLGNISLGMTADESPQDNEHLQAAEAACLQSRELSDRLMAFASGGCLRRPLCLESLLREAADRTLLETNVSCDLSEIAADIWPVSANFTQLLQALDDLLRHARGAMPAGGQVAAWARNVELGADSGLPIAAGRYVELAISDSSPGVPPEDLERLFDPYVRGRSQGDGLGLATAYWIVQSHGGHLRALSELGRGTILSIHLPASLPHQERLTPHAPDRPARSQGAPTRDSEPQEFSVLNAPRA